MYRDETDPDVHQQIDSLPAHALSDYAELRVVLEVSPWSGESLNNANPDALVRTCPSADIRKDWRHTWSWSDSAKSMCRWLSGSVSTDASRFARLFDFSGGEH